MKPSIKIVIVLALIILIGALSLSLRKQDDSAMMSTSSESAMTQPIEQTAPSKSTEMMATGTYEPFSPEKIALASATHDVVLFFRASWCPTCKVVDADIRANLTHIPESLTILDVDYDNSAELKKKYGVTYQHTFVQVDSTGALITKWSGSPTLSALIAEVR